MYSFHINVFFLKAVFLFMPAGHFFCRELPGSLYSFARLPRFEVLAIDIGCVGCHKRRLGPYLREADGGDCLCCISRRDRKEPPVVYLYFAPCRERRWTDLDFCRPGI